MELSDIVLIGILPNSFLLGLNIRTYEDTTDWLATHKIDNSFHEQFYEKFREKSLRGYLVYYLGTPRRQIAYHAHSK